MDIISSYGTVLVLVAAAVGFFMAYGIGANDVANAMGTSVGSKALTIKQAIIIAMIFEFAGAYLAGGEVTSTIRKGIIDAAPFADIPELMVLGMISALFAAGSWLLIASFLGWPVSTTHSIIGAIIGFALVAVGSEAIQWTKVAGIVGSWVVTPALSGFIAYLIFMSAQKLIFDTNNPLDNAKRYVPIYMGLAGFVMSLVTIKKGLKHIGINLGTVEGYALSVAIAVLIGIIGMLAIKRLKMDPKADKAMQFNNVEKVFAVLMVLTACCMAFAHGSNDVANAIGPLAAVVNIVENNGELAKKAALAWWILPLGGLGIVMGLAILGKKVIKTIGEGITHLTPSRGFAAELAAASTVVIASGTGLPISTTQTLVGAVLGVGMARGIAALNMSVIRNIVVSWVITLPVGAALAIVIFYILRTVFGV
ncbi:MULTISPECIES: inorganic phosphate transporter [Pseudoalteromonas]|uniref:Phosphate transporter n=1 Tax=Pseudoalteromonas ruthenica TaxID=151081 RepID=A0A0F4Q3C3_9GAMM|nr:MULTISPECIES: inorganic phosphate transporter [Pseudoalteromonas]KJY97807.1 inorganic phosphate transporter PiT family protein [Pseudoalteromonas ruthenica]KJZ01834.1 inorganic phosphate transporter PiT family protein [Pseudoalteromonas ruthenica]MCF2862719.1 inorganic phosphate transporter [Pseudoalteromonas sp. CNAT2-18]MCG7543308.1 inorganic phosphate transporter [Pseudoalteromonas sp. MM17-2]MCG7558829.1 inorganic phosphate transporter [Pseudoalteromonas sp. CNAT2-18.1]|tara:strand:+ start:4928 stop:6196 length:1269 start_codon:yes stop_codon:yes gene_type:complete